MIVVQNDVLGRRVRERSHFGDAIVVHTFIPGFGEHDATSVR